MVVTGGPSTGGPPPQTGAGAPRMTMPPPSGQPRYGLRPRYVGYGPPGGPGARPGAGGGAGNAGGSGAGPVTGDPDFDAKRPRKSVMRKTVDYNSSFMFMLERRIWQRDFRDRRALQPDVMYYPELLPPCDVQDNPANAVTTRFVKTATNKMRCPIFTLAWTPEGRRLITGASSGEFTLWNGLTFNFETILQAHDTPVRSMVWSHNDQWMVTGDHGGYVKYWQSNMNNVKMFQAHKEPVRCISFSPTDQKFASCSDDGTVRVWDFLSCTEERVLRGHGSDVKCVDWHPTKGLLASGSKDNQQPVKIWEPRSGAVLTTLHAHKSTVMDIGWNRNGNWLLTASRDHLLKLFDIRYAKEELQTFRGHKKEASTLAWHPVHEGVFASGGSDGSVMFWTVGADKEVGVIEQAHDSIVWSLAWHPIGHILCSGSNDHTCKFWTRNRPGDTMRDKYNLNTQPYGQEENAQAHESSSGNAHNSAVIPGMAPEDKVDLTDEDSSSGFSVPKIPGLDQELDMAAERKQRTPFAKPIPKSFQARWNQTGDDHTMAPPPSHYGNANLTPLGAPPTAQSLSAPQNLPHDCLSLQELQRQATAVVAFGNVYPVLPGSNLSLSILSGEQSVKDVIRTEFLAG